MYVTATLRTKTNTPPLVWVIPFFGRRLLFSRNICKEGASLLFSWKASKIQPLSPLPRLPRISSHTHLLTRAIRGIILAQQMNGQIRPGMLSEGASVNWHEAKLCWRLAAINDCFLESERLFGLWASWGRLSGIRVVATGYVKNRVVLSKRGWGSCSLAASTESCKAATNWSEDLMAWCRVLLVDRVNSVVVACF